MLDTFQVVKNRLPMAQVVGHYSATINKKFAEPAPCCGNKGCCSVSETKRTFKCFSCGVGGSVIDMVMAADKCDESQALRTCAELAGVEIKASGARGGEPKEPKESSRERIYRLTAEFYEEGMAKAKCPGKKWFCGERGHKESTLQKLRVGWARGRLVKHLEKHGFTAADVVKYGLAGDKDKDGKSVPPYDFYGKGVAVFPVLDERGRVVSFTCKDPAKKRKASLMKGVTKKWFINNPALFKRYDEIFVVEGENDVASLMDAGFDNVLGTAGGPGIEQVKLLKNFFAGKTVFLWFDKDPGRDPRKNEGGVHHTRFIYEQLRGTGIDVRVIVNPGSSKDPDEYIQGGWNV